MGFLFFFYGLEWVLSGFQRVFKGFCLFLFSFFVFFALFFLMFLFWQCFYGVFSVFGLVVFSCYGACSFCLKPSLSVFYYSCLLCVVFFAVFCFQRFL